MKKEILRLFQHLAAAILLYMIFTTQIWIYAAALVVIWVSASVLIGKKPCMSSKSGWQKMTEVALTFLLVCFQFAMAAGLIFVLGSNIILGILLVIIIFSGYFLEWFLWKRRQSQPW